MSTAFKLARQLLQKRWFFFCHSRSRWNTNSMLVYYFRLICFIAMPLFVHQSLCERFLAKLKKIETTLNGKETKKWRNSHHVVRLYLFDRKLICKCASNANKIPIKLSRQMPSNRCKQNSIIKVQKFFQQPRMVRMHCNANIINVWQKCEWNFHWISIDWLREVQNEQTMNSNEIDDYAMSSAIMHTDQNPSWILLNVITLTYHLNFYWKKFRLQLAFTTYLSHILCTVVSLNSLSTFAVSAVIHSQNSRISAGLKQTANTQWIFIVSFHFPHWASVRAKMLIQLNKFHCNQYQLA